MKHRDLGFNRVQDLIGEAALSRAGKNKTAELLPLANLSEVKVRQARIKSVQELLGQGEDLPLVRFIDLRAEFKRCRVAGSYFRTKTLTQLLAVIQQVEDIKKFYRNRKSLLKPLAFLFQTMTSLPEILRAIQKIIDEKGELRDSASSGLKKIRKEIKASLSQMHSEISRTMEKARQENWLHEDNPTIRNGRLVLPLKAECKRKIHGIVHGQSATGATAYVEPLIMVEINNRLKDLEQEEKNEIQKILRELTDQIRPHFEALVQNIAILADLDFIRACALFAKKFDCTVPQIREENSEMCLKNARHPLLSLVKEVVPLNFSPPEGIKCIIITGPNAGGKTVAMKTIGLLGIMAACGLPIPADENSSIPFFDGFLVDIGDQQSIEDDLSTFSSHVSNLKHFLNRSTPHSLVLIDELGTGTDPIEGSTLGQAVLEKLINLGRFTIATTHHSSLKAFADKNDQVMNAAMEFDTESLTPTYRLQLGLPGSSYALEIARRLGVQESVITRARQLLGSDQVKLENLLLEVEQLKTKMEEERAAVERNKRTLDKLVSRYEAKVAQLKEKHAHIDENLSRELERVVSESRARIENVVRQIKEEQASKESIKAAHKTVKDLAKKTDQQREPRKSSASQKTTQSRININDWVKIEGVDQRGRITAAPSGSKRIAVDIDGKKLWVDRKTVQQVSAPEVSKGETDRSSVTVNVSPVPSNQLDIRGQRADEAQRELIQYLDQAILSDLNEVEIIHGKGTGALQKMTHAVLGEHPAVTDFHFEDFDRGGTGATLVKFR